MESIAVILILAVVAVLALLIFKYVSGNIPSMTTSEIEDITPRIPEEFHNYVYYLDSTGVAFDPENGQVLLMGNALPQIYTRAQIRSVESRIVSPGEWYTTGGRLLEKACAAINTSLNNRTERRKAYNKSGLFVEIRDIDHPVWQIKFSEERMMNKYDEIFAQFRDGTLPPERKTS